MINQEMVQAEDPITGYPVGYIYDIQKYKWFTYLFLIKK